LGDHLFAAGDEICLHVSAFHTLLVGGAGGAGVRGDDVWTEPLRPFCEKGMQWMGLACRASLKKMLLAGVLGAWFHVGLTVFTMRMCRFSWRLCDDNPVNDG
jgi:hypothetical protein